MKLLVTICSHHFRLNRIPPTARPLVELFSRRFIQWGFKREHGRVFRAPVKMFAAATRDRSEYRFHINVLKDFKTFLNENHLKEEEVEWVYEDFFPTRSVELPIKPGWALRDYQESVVDYINKEEGGVSRLVGLQTGRGKSIISMMASARVNAFVLMIVRPMFIEKWLIDIYGLHDIKFEDVMVVQGSDHLKAFLELAKNGGVTSKVVIISNKTIQNYIKLYEEIKEGVIDAGYACVPHDLFKMAQSVRRVIDEVHLDFHLNFKLDLYTHVERAVSMSATMLFDDDYLNKMAELAYPSHTRYKDQAYKKYIKSRAVLYSCREPKRLRTTQFGSKSYSHHAFEASLVRNKQMLNNFFLLIKRLLEDSYFKNHKPGNKFIVFCASIEMCGLVSAFLQEQYKNLTIRRYVEDDPYENLVESDGVVSTMQSAGTAVDVPGLQTCIMSVALRSSQGNIQGFGRLREMKSGQQPEFIYMVCTDVNKHMEYHRHKEKLLEERSAIHSTEQAGTCI